MTDAPKSLNRKTYRPRRTNDWLIQTNKKFIPIHINPNVTNTSNTRRKPSEDFQGFQALSGGSCYGEW
ncbi:hypothetical protein C7B65_11970 [Phormidesmis priestleyi ULC007]|uniref:Uncharacterized protein n=1 Tax=Phormidesmis priestleyi ULC007 TaxID=1920490 RepID=A0A2T1DFP4_9CYAN|nr:hypothetical protein [Phormidesmis priestleyi]PSB19283.1 hypothetical protein C7B65_11970 [Phormidesmis priestleyi ULC007]PZO52168.1 MAG: hypothetical protein DCF14_06755 [Phormidesmis priestleyi]